MTEDHRACDDRFAATEEAVNNQDWETAEASYDEFVGRMEHHLGMEEVTLFPAFEEAIGSDQGPTSIMRLEHEQMRELIQQMHEALADRDAMTFLGVSETLLVMMQQHNVKEENILYPMTDQALAGTDVLARMRRS